MIFPIMLAVGVFVGNFMFHAVNGNYAKGVVIGGIAAALVLIFYVIKELFGNFFLKH